MSTSNFTVTEHQSPCQHIREFHHGVKREDAVLHLAVKEYQPHRKLQPSDENSAVTIIASHGNGFPKECYEALWDDLLASETTSFKIRSIWIADVAHQGASYALNKDDLGDDNNWLDHSRDLLFMVNQFREKMKPPFVGLAHSMGCANIAWLSIIHPRLFHSVILIEPILVDRAPPGPNTAMMSSMRKETIPSRTIAEAQISKNPFFKTFDPRVLRTYLKHALVDRQDGSVTLATPKAQEAWSYVRANFHPIPEDTTTLEARNRERLLNPDYVPFLGPATAVFTRPEAMVVMEALPHLRPRTLFVYGEYSHLNDDTMREMHLSKTGVGHGGNGGVADGGTEVKVVEDSGHLCCFDKPTVMAKDISGFLDKEMVRWRKEESFWATYDNGTSQDNGTRLSDKWLKGVKEDSLLQRPILKGVAKL